MLKRHSQFFKGLMLLSDLVILSLGWWLAYLIRFHIPLFASTEQYVPQHYVAAWLLILAIWAAVFVWLDLYRPRRISTHWQEFMDLLRGSSLALLIFLGSVFVIRDIVLSRMVVVLFWTTSLAMLNLTHLGFREGLRFLRRRGYNLRHIAVIGPLPQASALVHKLEWYRHLGLAITGVCLIGDDRKTIDWPEHLSKTPDEIAALVRAGQFDQIFITLPLEEASSLREIQGWFGDEPITLHFVPDLGDLRLLGNRIEEFEGIQIISLQDSPVYGWSSLQKRTIDLIFGGLALISLLPLMLIIAVAVKLTSRGPILYRQQRMGLDGKKFDMLKFRTMVDGAEKHTGPVWATDGDPRVTLLGRWLRRMSLDELPQLVNVLRGEMSLVGPRPERPPLIEEFRKSIPKYMLRHKVKAGMTGWAQVNGWRGNTSLEARIAHDLDYIEHWSIASDLKILFLTLMCGFRSNRGGQPRSLSRKS